MSRVVPAVLTAALAVYSYFEIKTSLPLLTAQIMTHRGATAPVSHVLSLGLHITWFLQVFLAAFLLAAPYIAPQTIHFGSWRLSRYSPSQQELILPLVRELTGLLALLVSCYFSARIYLEIHDAGAHGPVLPVDWIKNVDRTELEWLLALMVICGIIIYLYIVKFDDAAGGE
jgi:uncharacterized membrane protein